MTESMEKAFEIEYQMDDLIVYAGALSAALGAPMLNNEIIYPADVADGGSKFFTINEYLSFQLVQYRAKKKMIFHRRPSKGKNIKITFQDFTFIKCREHTDCNEICLNKDSLSSIQCKSTLIDETIVIEPGQEARVIVVLLKENWVDHVLHDSVSKEKFIRYLVHQNANLRKEFLSCEQNKLFNEVFNNNTFTLLEHLYYEGRVLNLLESFLKEILIKEEDSCSNFIASDEDTRMIRAVEAYLQENLMNPFPGVDVLSRKCCMSRTKFINLFQKVYGESSFDYYQRKRLNIAYEFMKSGKYSVTDTAQIIGYSSINNFATAFKKEFGLLPSELLIKIKTN